MIPEGSSSQHANKRASGPASQPNYLPVKSHKSFSCPGREAHHSRYFSKTFRCEGGSPSWTHSRGHVQHTKEQTLTFSLPPVPLSLCGCFPPGLSPSLRLPVPSPLGGLVLRSCPHTCASFHSSHTCSALGTLLMLSLSPSRQAHTTVLITHWSLALPGHRAPSLVTGFWATARVGITLTSHCALEGLPLEDPVRVV